MPHVRPRSCACAGGQRSCTSGKTARSGGQLHHAKQSCSFAQGVRAVTVLEVKTEMRCCARFASRWPSNSVGSHEHLA